MIVYLLLAALVLPYVGCLVQHDYKNQLADVYSFALGTVCCTAASLSFLFDIDLYATTLLGCLVCCGLYYTVSNKSKSTIIIYGMILGVIVGAIGTIVNNNISPENLQKYYRWSSTTFDVPLHSVHITLLLIGVAWFVRCKTLRAMLLLSSIIFVTGPIWTVSLLAPNLARLFSRPYTRKWYRLSIVFGAMAIIASQLVISLQSVIYLPFSATLAIITAPCLIYVYTRNI